MQLVKSRPVEFLRSKLFLTALLAASLTTAASAGVKVGDAFPDVTKFGLDGTIPDLKGKVVMVDFWASWCGPCKESFPAMNGLQQQFADKGVVILAINVDENKSDMDAFLKDHPATFAVVRDARQKLVDKVEIGTMPSSFILNKEGKVVATHSGFEGEKTRKQYEEELNNLLK